MLRRSYAICGKILRRLMMWPRLTPAVTWNYGACVVRIERYGTGFLFEEPNPTGSRARDLIGHSRQQDGSSYIQTREGKEEGDQRRAERVQKLKPANMQRRCIHEGRIQEIAICRNCGETVGQGLYMRHGIHFHDLVLWTISDRS